MKRLILLLVILSISGCAGNSFICLHKTQVQNILNGILIAANVLEATLPATSPIVEKVKVIEADAQVLLNQACPTIQQASDLSNKLTQIQQAAVAAGYVRLKK